MTRSALGPGDRIAHFTIVERLGAGGMGEVYRAHDEHLKREVALKVLPRETVAEPSARARLLREARSVAALNHPHVCAVYEIGEERGQDFIAMELVEGRPLNELGGVAGFKPAAVVRIGIEIAEALAHAHGRGVVHRDLKSSNVMVTSDGHVKVLDFGLARLVPTADSSTVAAASQSLTEAGAIVGTTHYLPPEVLSGAEADARGDIWALGVMLHEMVAGELPFDGHTRFEVAAAIMHSPPRPLPEDVPAGLRAVIARCLEKEPARRYRRAGEVRAALEAAGSDTAPGDGGRVCRSNLPVPATPFLGREKELAEVLSLLTREGTHLLTLTGPGGTGKTRLTLKAAAQASDSFPDGVFWVALAALRDHRLVLPLVGRVLEINEQLGELLDTLGSQLEGRRLLLVLDNAEHLLPELASTLAALAAACPTLRLLVTSRESLQIAVEIEHPVPTLEPADGVALFRERAAAHGVDVALSPAVEELCARLDELPLALELAAARMKLFSPEELLERISQRLDLLKAGRDADPRQQTLRATIQWSHDLLTDQEQQLFCRLSVFAGGCTYETAEHVAGADPDTLQSLLDKSLVRRRDSDHAPRYWMLETIRDYAAERLSEGQGEETIREQHLDHYLALAERAYEGRFASAFTWSPIVEAEHDNIRAALDWARIRRPQTEAQLAGAIAFYWYLRGHAREVRERLSAALARYVSRDRTRARALTFLGQALNDQREDEALSCLEEALDLWRELGDPRGEALALEDIGHTHINFGHYAPARVALERSLLLRRQAGAPEVEGLRAFDQLCHILVATGEIDRAEPMAREVCTLGAKYGARRTQELGLHFLADCALIGGGYADAEDRYRRALGFARDWGLMYRYTDELRGVAMAAAGRGDHALAVRLAAAAHRQDEALGLAPGDNWWTRIQERFIGGARAQLTPEELEAAERAGKEAPFEAVLDDVLGAGTEPVTQ